MKIETFTEFDASATVVDVPNRDWFSDDAVWDLDFGPERLTEG